MSWKVDVNVMTIYSLNKNHTEKVYLKDCIWLIIDHLDSILDSFRLFENWQANCILKLDYESGYNVLGVKL